MAVCLCRGLLLCVFLAALQTHGLPTKQGEKVASSPEEMDDAELMTGDDGEDEEEVEDSNKEGQHLFPSFSSLFSGGSHLGSSRSFYPEFTAPPRSFNTEPSFHHSGFPLTSRALYTSAEETDRVLGSGNFGIIRGGTYFGGSGDEAGGYTRGVNSHGRPYRRPNPPPQYKSGGDFFSGFRDFADITTPPKSAYSNIYVVYANRNGTQDANGSTRPKNIRELIDSDSNLDYADAEDDKESETPLKSKTKKKLSLYRQKEAIKDSLKKFRSKNVDPLIALS